MATSISGKAAMAIEHSVSRAITRIHALERALHEIGPWYVRSDTFMVPAEREVTDRSVVFRAFVPPRTGGYAELWLRDEYVSSIDAVHGGMHGRELVYELGLAVEKIA